MKYIEELSVGDTFTHKDNIFILTADFKKNHQRNCVCLTTGLSRWFEASDIVDLCPVYTLDKQNNVIPMRITSKP